MFSVIIGHLLSKGVVVILDEFQNSVAPAHLVGEIKILIDGQKIPRPEGGNRHYPGKLVLTGSHQQKFRDMFNVEAPMYGRPDGAENLLPWTPREVMEMAAEQGFLSRPGRLLTLWTSFNGLPGLWEDFVTRETVAYPDFHEFPDDDRAWRQAFLEAEFSRLRKNSDDRFDSRQYVEMPEPLRSVMLDLGRYPRSGLPISQLMANIGATIDQEDLVNRLQKLRETTGLIHRHSFFLGSPKDPVWRIADLSCLFQLNVFPELSNLTEDPDDTEQSEDSSKVLARLETMEGLALETFTAKWLSSRPGNIRSLTATSAIRPGKDRDKNNIEVDVFAGITDSQGRHSLVLASCKRNPQKHRPEPESQQFKKFIDLLSEDEMTGMSHTTAKFIRNVIKCPPRQLLVSPYFSNNDRRRYAKSGFECIDIRDMAKETGLEVGTIVGPELDSPANEDDGDLPISAPKKLSRYLPLTKLWSR